MNMGLGITKAGGCTYTALKMHNYAHKDPALTLPLNCIVDFVQAVGAGSQKMMLQAIWKEVYDDLLQGQRWAKVRGPASAAMASLLDINWTCQTFDTWVDFEGTEWKVDFSTPFGPSALREVLHYTIDMNLQSEAADHIHSFGAEASAWQVRPDLQPAKAMLGKLHKSHKWKELYWLEAIAQGAMDLHTQCHVYCNQARVSVCAFCNQPVPFSPWEHLA